MEPVTESTRSVFMGILRDKCGGYLRNIASLSPLEAGIYFG